MSYITVVSVKYITVVSVTVLGTTHQQHIFLMINYVLCTLYLFFLRRVKQLQIVRRVRQQYKLSLHELLLLLNLEHLCIRS